MLFCRLSLAALAPFAACTLLSASASAQTAQVVVNSNVTRTVALRNDPVNNLWISRGDCLADDTMTFPVVISGPVTGFNFEVWASSGASCLPAESRTTAAAQCWRVYAGLSSTSIQNIPIRVQDIAAMKKPPTFTASVGTAADCTPTATATSAQPITLFFMLVSGGENQGGSSWATKLDLVAPNPPIENPLGVGNTLLTVDWAATTDPDIAGYDFFCDPPAGTVVSPVNAFGPGSGDSGAAGSSAAGSNDAGAASGSACTDAAADATSGDEAGADATSNDAADEQICTTTSTGTGTSATGTDAAVSGSNCGSTHLFAGVVPDAAFAATFGCGSVAGIQSKSFNITGLANNVPYTVATSAVDGVGNIGALSNVQCDVPQVVYGFPELYHSAGGTAGGGFCAMGRFPSRGGGWAGASLLALGMGLRRRRRRPASS